MLIDNRGHKDFQENLPQVGENQLNIELPDEVKVLPQVQRKKIILVAEDDDFNYFLVESFLFAKNYEVVHARNGQEAVNIFCSMKEISLVLMDLQMPVMDGFTATKEIRKIDQNVPIIAQTAYIIDDLREKAVKAGCNDLLTKPLNHEFFIYTVEKYLG